MLKVYVDGVQTPHKIEVCQDKWSRNPLKAIRQLFKGRDTYEVLTLEEAPSAGARIVVIDEVEVS